MEKAQPLAGSRPARILVLATDEIAGSELIDEFRHHLRGDRAGADVLVVVPAAERTPFLHALGDVDGAAMEAKKRLRTSIEGLRRAGVSALGEIGDSDPLIAAEDALLRYPADEVLIVAHAEDQTRWFEEGLIERAKESLDPPLRMVTVRRVEGDGVPHLAGVEEAGPGREPAPQDGHDLEISSNLPVFSRGGLAGMAMAVIGTIAVIVLAAVGPGPDSTGGAAQILIAMAVALVNMAHVVGLTLLESVHYRGGWQRFFRSLSLTVTPVAIVVNGLISLID
jgi:hypothetical protein